MRAFERWCHVRLLAAMQHAGLLLSPGARVSAEDVLALHRLQGLGSGQGAAPGAPGGPGAGHARLVAALLETLERAGFLEGAGAGQGCACAAAGVAGTGVAAELAVLGEAAGALCAEHGSALASYVKLVDACLGALPGILSGVVPPVVLDREVPGATCRPRTMRLSVGNHADRTCGPSLDWVCQARHSTRAMCESSPVGWAMLCAAVTLAGSLREGDRAPLVRTRQAAQR